jgi:plasmid stability protein
MASRHIRVAASARRSKRAGTVLRGSQLTVRSVPPAVDRALRHKAANERRSLNAVMVEALGRGAGLEAAPIHDDLDHLAGRWEEDQAFDAAVAAQDEVDENLWR